MRTPVRIQRKRTKGWRMPPNTVYVGRGTKWGNPFIQYNPVLAAMTFSSVIQASFKPKWWKYPTAEEIQRELCGKNLACWCPLEKATFATGWMPERSLGSCDSHTPIKIGDEE